MIQTLLMLLVLLVKFVCVCLPRQHRLLAAKLVVACPVTTNTDHFHNLNRTKCHDESRERKHHLQETAKEDVAADRAEVTFTACQQVRSNTFLRVNMDMSKDGRST